VRRETPPRLVGYQPEAGRARHAPQAPNLGSAQPTAGDPARRHLLGAGGFASPLLGDLSPDVVERWRRYAGVTLDVHFAAIRFVVLRSETLSALPDARLFRFGPGPESRASAETSGSDVTAANGRRG
jgi:hypothetical protein